MPFYLLRFAFLFSSILVICLLLVFHFSYAMLLSVFAALSSILYSISRFLSLDVCFSAIHTLLPTELLFKISSILGFWRNETCPPFFFWLTFFLSIDYPAMPHGGWFFFYALLYHVGFSFYIISTFAEEELTFNFGIWRRARGD